MGDFIEGFRKIKMNNDNGISRVSKIEDPKEEI